MDLFQQEKRITEEKNTVEIVFTTLGLEGSLAVDSLPALREEYESALKEAADQQHGDCRIRRLKRVYFSKIDSLLDNGQEGPQWLKKYELAKYAVSSLEELKKKGMSSVSYTILPNHIHLLYEADPNKADLLIDVFKKGLAGKIREATGYDGNVWLTGNFSHKIDDQKEMIQLISYILENPVKAGLVDYWKDWPWTYCDPNYL